MILSGRRILVVEDEPILALDLEAALQHAGAEVIGPAITLETAQALASRNGLSAAVLDVRLGRNDVFSVAELLHEKEIPFLFHTAHPDEELNERWPAAPLISKPSSTTVIISTLARLLRGGNAEGREGLPAE